MVELAITQDPSAIQFASPHFKKEFAHHVLSINSFNLKYYKDLDFEIPNKKICQYLKNNGEGYQFLSKEQKEDRENIINALSENGLMLSHVPAEFKNDREIVLKAITHEPKAV
mmetsp:Transcript_37384/g.33523  ORF Transcript_37384/g.33523 Transcript_37384/m.33523 type:complete len:113 (-) Transcript_37384:39-377(-)